jgi:hypothetical protein
MSGMFYKKIQEIAQNGVPLLVSVFRVGNVSPLLRSRVDRYRIIYPDGLILYRSNFYEDLPHCWRKACYLKPYNMTLAGSMVNMEDYDLENQLSINSISNEKELKELLLIRETFVNNEKEVAKKYQT